MKSILAFTILAIACSAAQASEPSRRPPLELKGIKLGDDLAIVQTALQGVECETFPHPSLAQCWLGKGGTIGGKPTQILVRLLDGKVVYVNAGTMTQDDAYTVIDALKEKYGAPDREPVSRVTIVRPTKDQSIPYKVPQWLEDSGNQMLTVLPADFTNERKQFTYAALLLFDKSAHNTWLARKQRGADVNDL